MKQIKSNRQFYKKLTDSLSDSDCLDFIRSFDSLRSLKMTWEPAQDEIGIRYRNLPLNLKSVYLYRK